MGLSGWAGRTDLHARGTAGVWLSWRCGKGFSGMALANCHFSFCPLPAFSPFFLFPFLLLTK